jgi:hypothetical protein
MTASATPPERQGAVIAHAVRDGGVPLPRRWQRSAAPAHVA